VTLSLDKQQQFGGIQPHQPLSKQYVTALFRWKQQIVFNEINFINVGETNDLLYSYPFSKTRK
jgi:hypothetical protein